MPTALYLKVKNPFMSGESVNPDRSSSVHSPVPPAKRGCSVRKNEPPVLQAHLLAVAKSHAPFKPPRNSKLAVPVLNIAPKAIKEASSAYPQVPAPKARPRKISILTCASKGENEVLHQFAGPEYAQYFHRVQGISFKEVAFGGWCQQNWGSDRRGPGRLLGAMGLWG